MPATDVYNGPQAAIPEGRTVRPHVTRPGHVTRAGHATQAGHAVHAGYRHAVHLGRPALRTADGHGL